ncbi:MAG: YbaY family lipoprotein, partial [Pseudomonadota bacterium]
QDTISVSVTYREKIALPPDAILEVELLDVSLMDVPATVLTRMRFKQDSVPFELELPYDPILIQEGLSYVVAARILSNGQVSFRTTSAYPVLTRDAGESADLVLQAMPPVTDAQTGTEQIAGVDWVLTEIGGTTLEGEALPTISFLEDGSFSIFGGCNQFVGQAEIGDGTITFPENFAGTLRACGEEIQKLERDVVAAISASSKFVKNVDRLIFQREDGSVTVRMRERI